jgi:hypothetical protein
MAEMKPFSDNDQAVRQNIGAEFLRKSYFEVMEKIYEVCQSNGVTKTEVLCELDFYGDAPALKDQFKVGLVKRYLEGSRPDEPDWFHKGASVYRRNIKNFNMGLEDHYNRMTPNHILAIIRYSDGSFSVYRFQMTNQSTGHQIFGEEAMNAVGSGNEVAIERILGQMGRDYLYREALKELSLRAQNFLREHPRPPRG